MGLSLNFWARSIFGKGVAVHANVMLEGSGFLLLDAAASDRFMKIKLGSAGREDTRKR